MPDNFTRFISFEKSSHQYNDDERIVEGYHIERKHG